MRKCERLFVSRVTGGNWGCGTRPTRRLRRLDRHYRRRPCRGDDRASPAIAAGFVASHVAPITTSATNTTASRISVEPSPPSGEKPKYRSINCIGPVRAFSAANTSAANTTLMVAKPTATPPLSNVSKATSVASLHAYRVLRMEPTRNAQGMTMRYGSTFACLKEDRSEASISACRKWTLGQCRGVGAPMGVGPYRKKRGRCRRAARGWPRRAARGRAAAA